MIKNSRNISFNKARQLDFAAHLISTLTKELIENGTKYVKVLYTFAYRSIEIFAKPICSVRAYNDFYAKTGRDIRTFNGYRTDDVSNTIKDKKGKGMVVHQHYRWEHMDTGNDMNLKLVEAYKTKQLTIPYIKNLILKQRICGITLEEDKALTKAGYRSHRDDPDRSYLEVGIRIK